MVNQELLNYVRGQLAAGVSKEALTITLTTQGWQVADVSSALAEATSVPRVTPTPLVNSDAEQLAKMIDVGTSLQQQQPRKASIAPILTIAVILAFIAAAIGVFGILASNPTIFSGHAS